MAAADYYSATPQLQYGHGNHPTGQSFDRVQSHHQFYSDNENSRYNQHNNLGGRNFNHGPSPDVESHYDDLRQQARDAHDKHDFKDMERLNEEAADYIFAQNNALSKENEIDLHGLFVKEVEERLDEELEKRRRRGVPGPLHIIVGKGNHSPGHIQKVKPAVEKYCAQHGLQFETEHNEGRIRVFTGPGGHSSPEPAYVGPPGLHPQSSPHGSPQHKPSSPHSPHQPSPYQQPPPYQPSPGYAGQTPQQSPGFGGFPGQQQGGYQTPGKPEYHQQQSQGGQQGHAGLSPQEEKMAFDVLRQCMRRCCSVM